MNGTENEYGKIGATHPSLDCSLKGKLVKCQRGPATVYGSNLPNVTVLMDGKTGGSDDHEPGNLPILYAPRNLRG